MIWMMRVSPIGLDNRTEEIIEVGDGPYNRKVITRADAVLAVRDWGKYNKFWHYELIDPKPIQKTFEFVGREFKGL